MDNEYKPWIQCPFRTSSEFYLGDELGNMCLDVCRLKSQDKDQMIYLEDAIIDDIICSECMAFKSR